MAQFVFRQPDGFYAVFSTVSDTFLLLDATAQELVDWFGDHARKQAKEDAWKEIKKADEGREPYGLNWEDAVAKHHRRPGEEDD